MSKKNVIIVASLGLILFICGAWATWYSYNRQMIIAQIEKCNYEMNHPKPPTMIPGPDGKIVPVMIAEICPIVPMPPSLQDVLRGRIVFEGVQKGLEVNPYSLKDILLGNYTLGPARNMPCDQSATTTPCATLEALKAGKPSAPAPYIPPNVVSPIAEWTSATDTPVTFSGFTFQLPLGWHGEVYEKGFSGGVHALIQSESSDRGFTIDCPPDGKGLEAATRLSSEEQTFMKNSIAYSTAFEEWTAPGNDPWYFVWIRVSESGDTSANTKPLNACLAQGSATPAIKNAMSMLYETVR